MQGETRDEGARANFEMDVAGLRSAYELRGTQAWTAAVEAIASADKVHVAGFQTIAGLASGYATRLAYLRDETHIEAASDGIFGTPGPGRCIVLFEMRRNTATSYTLAAAAAEEGIPLVVVCDTHCSWARDYTGMALPLRTASRLFWDSHVPFSCLSALRLDDIVTGLGDGVSDRLEHVRRLQDRFGAFRD